MSQYVQEKKKKRRSSCLKHRGFNSPIRPLEGVLSTFSGLLTYFECKPAGGSHNCSANVFGRTPTSAAGCHSNGRYKLLPRPKLSSISRWTKLSHEFDIWNGSCGRSESTVDSGFRTKRPPSNTRSMTIFYTAFSRCLRKNRQPRRTNPYALREQ